MSSGESFQNLWDLSIPLKSTLKRFRELSVAPLFLFSIGFINSFLSKMNQSDVLHWNSRNSISGTNQRVKLTAGYAWIVCAKVFIARKRTWSLLLTFDLLLSQSVARTSSPTCNSNENQIASFNFLSPRTCEN